MRTTNRNLRSVTNRPRVPSSLAVAAAIAAIGMVLWVPAGSQRVSPTAAARAAEAAVEPFDYEPLKGGLGVATEDLTWTDAARDRDVPVRIYAPALDAGRGPFPAVVFSHGGGESREAFGYLGDALAKHGHIVVFLTHQRSDRGALRERGLAALGASAFEDRPADVVFAIDRLLAAGPDEKLLNGRVDPDRIAVAGQCAGATTALAVAGLTTEAPDGKLRSYRDPRPKAVVALSPQPGANARRAPAESLHDRSWKTVALPALVVTGTRDFRWIPAVRNDPELVRRPYTAMSPGDKYLVEIVDAEHHAFTDSQPYYPGGPRDPRHHGWIARATAAFLDAFLKDDRAALDWLRAKRLQAATKGQCQQEHKPDSQDKQAEVVAKAAEREAHDFAPVDTFLEKSLPRVDGGCALILIQGDEVIYRKAFGVFTPQTVVPIASASKWISGGVIMALVDDGTISLDDKASDYLPAFTGEKANITVRQMFSHTHGFPSGPLHHRNTGLTLEEAVDKIAQVPLAYDPGTELLYSGLGMQVAARIAEVAAGKPWVEIFGEKIADPLEMKSTTYYAFGETGNPNVAGSVETSIDDYGNFVAMVLNQGVFRGRRVLSDKAVETMLTNQSGDVPIRRHPWRGYTDFDPRMATTPYGIGCWLEEVDSRTGKAWRASSGGAFGCQPFVDLKRNLAGVFLPHARAMKRASNGMPYNDASVVYLELREILNTILDGRPPPAAAATAADDTLHETEPTAGPELHERVERIFQFADRDGDGKLSREEVPERMRVLRQAFDRVDRDRDGKLDRNELRSGFQAIRNRLPPRNRLGGADGASTSSPDSSSMAMASAPPSIPYKPHGGPYPVDFADPISLVDAKRDKTLHVRVTYPQGDGPFPVILFSHFVGGARHDYQPLVAHWASHGYVCVQPDHSDSRAAGDGEPETFRDDRVAAALLLSPQGRGQGLTDRSWEDVARPMLVMAGTETPSRRTGNPPEWRTEPFAFAKPGDKYLVFIDGLDKRYAGLITGDTADEALAGWIKSTTLAFWDAHLKGMEEPRGVLDSAGWEEGSQGRVKISVKG